LVDIGWEKEMSDNIIAFPRSCSICGIGIAEHIIDSNGFAAMDEMICEHCVQALYQLQLSSLAKQNREMRMNKLRVVQ
jgi:hypothetical protein